MRILLRLIAFQCIGNFTQAGCLLVLAVPVTATASEEGHFVIDIERDARIGIGLKFGSITFKEEPDGTYATSLVDVLVGDIDMAPEADTRIQMDIRLMADPGRVSILEVTERLRTHIVRNLRAAADALDAASARSLLFYKPEPDD